MKKKQNYSMYQFAIKLNKQLSALIFCAFLPKNPNARVLKKKSFESILSLPHCYNFTKKVP